MVSYFELQQQQQVSRYIVTVPVWFCRELRVEVPYTKRGHFALEAL